MVNEVILLGNVGSDPKVGGNEESRNCSFSLATSERYTKNNGEVVERTEWHRIVAFGKLGEFVRNYVAKGKQVYVNGKMHTRSYKDENGIERFVTEVLANELKLGGKKQE